MMRNFVDVKFSLYSWSDFYLENFVHKIIIIYYTVSVSSLVVSIHENLIHKLFIVRVYQ